MKAIEKIYVEKENVSDTEYLITDVLVGNGEEVKEGDLVLSFETSKADVDIESPVDGFVLHPYEKGSRLEPGDLAVVIVDEQPQNQDEDLKNYFLKQLNTNPIQVFGNIRISNKAKKLLEQHKIDLENFKDKSVIREKDITQFLTRQKEVDANTLIDDLPQADPNNVVIIGGRGGGKMMIDALIGSEYQIVGILDDALESGEEVMGHRVIGSTSILPFLMDRGHTKLILCFGNIFNREKRLTFFHDYKAKGFQFPNVIHPKAIVEPSATLGEGNIVLAGSIIGSEAILGDLNYINTGSIVSHECKLEDNVHMSPGAIAGGRVKIGSNTLIGMNSTIYFDASIGSEVTINNGVNIFRDVPDGEIIK